MGKVKETIAQVLLSVGCIKVSPQKPFLYASGLMGPIYCDNRKILSFVNERDTICKALIDLVKESNCTYKIIAGLATAGIPHAAFLADRLKRPMIYIRGAAKDHGQQNQIEGNYQAGDRIILIEDLVNQGKSVGEAIMASKDAGLNPVACFSIVDYEMKKAREILNNHQLPLFSLTNFSSIIKVANQLSKFTKQELEILTKWQQDPVNWNL